MNVCARHEYPPDDDIRLQLGSSDSNSVSLTGLGKANIFEAACFGCLT